MDMTTMNPLEQLCSDYAHNSRNYHHWFLIPAVAIIILLCLMEKRKSFKPSLMGGRPGIVRPFGVLDESSNRWGIMFVFGSVTGYIMLLIQKALLEQLNWPVWTKIFLVYIYCLEVSVISYPLFACMTTRHKLVGAVVGLLYSLGWFAFEMFKNVVVGICLKKYMDNQYGVSTSAYALIAEIPVTVCNFFVLLKFFSKLYKCFKKRIYKISEEEQVKLCKSCHLTYVKNLLNKKSENLLNDSLTWKQHIQHKLIRQVPGFRFPIAIIIATFMSGVMLYTISLACAVGGESLARTEILKKFEDLIQTANVIATIITFLCGISNIYVFLINYRRDLLLLYKGDKSFIPRTVRTSSPNVYMARGMRFIGTSITGMFWFFFYFRNIILLPGCICVVGNHVCSNQSPRPEWAALPNMGAVSVACVYITIALLYFQRHTKEMKTYPICMITIFKIQTFLIGRFFIQPKLNVWDENRPLAVDNRTAYDVYSFFTIFLNASIGFFTFLKRILISVLLGVFLIPRMDRSLLMRGYEGMDKCYVNYIGMIMVDEAHNHPVMRVFCFLVKTDVENRRDRKPLRSAVENPVYGNLSSLEHILFETGKSLAKKRWWLIFTLLRNPTLTALRVRECKTESRHRATLSPTDIKYDDEAQTFEKDNSVDSWGFSMRCCRNYKLKIPPNLLINVMAVIVLLAGFITYAGIGVLLNKLVLNTERLILLGLSFSMNTL